MKRACLPFRCAKQVCLALIECFSASQTLVAFSTCTDTFSPSISETRRHWLSYFSCSELFWMMIEVYCGNQDLTFVIQKSCRRKKGKDCVGSRRIEVAVLGQTGVPSVFVFGNMVSDSRCAGNSRTG